MLVYIVRGIYCNRYNLLGTQVALKNLNTKIEWKIGEWIITTCMCKYYNVLAFIVDFHVTIAMYSKSNLKQSFTLLFPLCKTASFSHNFLLKFWKYLKVNMPFLNLFSLNTISTLLLALKMTVFTLRTPS